MSCFYVCDGCGKTEKARFYKSNPTRFFDPADWFERGDEDGIQNACSRECVKKIAEETKKTSVVIPL